MLRVKGADTLCPLGPGPGRGLGLPRQGDPHLRQRRGARRTATPTRWSGTCTTSSPTSPARSRCSPATCCCPARRPISRTVYPGDVVEVEVEGLGTLRNHIVDGPDADPHRRRRAAHRVRGGALDRAGRRLGVPRHPQARPEQDPLRQLRWSSPPAPTDRRIPARFSASASALRYRAEVSAPQAGPGGVRRRRRAAAAAPAGARTAIDGRRAGRARARRIWLADGVLLPGGGDLAAHWAGQQHHETQYDVDESRTPSTWPWPGSRSRTGIPLLAICRGLAGGQRRPRRRPGAGPGRDARARTTATSSTTIAVARATRRWRGGARRPADDLLLPPPGPGRLGEGCGPSASPRTATSRRSRSTTTTGWFLGVQWHPEDTADTIRARRVFGRWSRPSTARGLTSGGSTIRRAPRSSVTIARRPWSCPSARLLERPPTTCDSMALNFG